jgi:hypothetical protein
MQASSLIEDPKLSTRPSLAILDKGLTKNEALAAKFATWFPKAKEQVTALAKAADSKLRWQKWLLLGGSLLAVWFLFFRGGSK